MSEREYDFPPVAPIPPDQLPVAPEYEVSTLPLEPPLTEKCWSVWAAVGFVALTGLLTVGGGLLSVWMGDLTWFKALGPNVRAGVSGGVLIGAYALIVVAVWLSARASGVPLRGAVGLRRVPVLPTLAVGFGIAVGARILAGLYALLLQAAGIELPGQNLDPTRLLPSTALGVALTVILACVAAPIAEEMVFRGVLLPALADRWGALVGLSVSSAVFAVMHVLPFAIPPIFVLALLLGRIFIRSRSLWVSISSHAMFNLIGIVAVYALKWTGVV